MKKRAPPALVAGRSMANEHLLCQALEWTKIPVLDSYCLSYRMIRKLISRYWSGVMICWGPVTLGYRITRSLRNRELTMLHAAALSREIANIMLDAADDGSSLCVQCRAISACSHSILLSMSACDDVHPHVVVAWPRHEAPVAHTHHWLARIPQ